MRTGLAIAVVVGAWVSAATIAWAGSYPGGNLAIVFAAFVVVGLTGLAWLVLAVTEIVVPRFALPVTLAVLAGVVIGGSGLAARIELPLLARFAASRPGLRPGDRRPR